MPSAALTTMELDETLWIAPRSKTSVFGPFLVAKVIWPCSARRTSRRSLSRSLR